MTGPSVTNTVRRHTCNRKNTWFCWLLIATPFVNSRHSRKSWIMKQLVNSKPREYIRFFFRGANPTTNQMQSNWTSATKTSTNKGSLKSIAQSLIKEKSSVNKTSNHQESVPNSIEEFESNDVCTHNFQQIHLHYNWLFLQLFLFLAEK